MWLKSRATTAVASNVKPGVAGGGRARAGNRHLKDRHGLAVRPAQDPVRANHRVAGRATWGEKESAAEGALAAAAEGALAAQMAVAIGSQGDAVAAAITALGTVMAAAIEGGKERGSGGLELAEIDEI